MQTVLYKIKTAIVKIFSGSNLFVHFLAIGLTVMVVMSGLDGWYFSATRNPTLQSYLFPAAIIGGVLPLLIPLCMFIIGKIKKSATLINATYAVIQAVIMGSIISSTYKAFTGRAHPYIHKSALLNNIANNPLISIDTLSKKFDFGFWNGGIFWGWPSSHTTIAFAMALTIWVLFRKNTIVKYIAIIVAAYIGVSVSTNIHWLSDGIAGALIGSIIGLQIGKNFLERQK